MEILISMLITEELQGKGRRLQCTRAVVIDMVLGPQKPAVEESICPGHMRLVRHS